MTSLLLIWTPIMIPYTSLATSKVTGNFRVSIFLLFFSISVLLMPTIFWTTLVYLRVHLRPSEFLSMNLGFIYSNLCSLPISSSYFSCISTCLLSALLLYSLTLLISSSWALFSSMTFAISVSRYRDFYLSNWIVSKNWRLISSFSSLSWWKSFSLLESLESESICLNFVHFF